MRCCVYFEDPHTIPVIQNVEATFALNRFSLDGTDRKIVQTVEKGELVDGKVFLDRFGYHLPLSELSTGSKAGIVTHHQTDCLVDLRGCGINAKSAILAFCQRGNILMKYPSCGVIDYADGTKIDVFLEDRHFVRMGDLMYYLSDGRILEHCH